MKCATCGKEFPGYHARDKFCSKACKNAFHNELRRKALAAYRKKKR
jgi:endogenous inhibitor of DNA gyrase (YacG/DUF329 family)